MGKGVTKAVENINTVIGPALVGKDPTDQAAVDQAMMDLDGGAAASPGTPKQRSRHRRRRHCAPKTPPSPSRVCMLQCTLHPYVQADRLIYVAVTT
jgi:hypothetical protein